MSTKPTVEAIRAEVAELVSQCPSKAAHDVAAYLASKNYRYGIIAVLIALTQDNCYVNVSDDEDDLIDYIAKAAVKHWGEPIGGFVDRLLMETFDIVYGDTSGVKAAKHYAEWMTTEAYNLGDDTWFVRMDNKPKPDMFRVGFVHSTDCKPSFYDFHSERQFTMEREAKHFAAMLSAISGYPMG